jgi:hypothetical protein
MRKAVLAAAFIVRFAKTVSNSREGLISELAQGQQQGQ